jgi:hypothetical protein
MTTVLAIIGVAMLLGVWALYVRVGLLFETFLQEVRAERELLKQELSILWVAVSSDPEARAERRKEYGLGPLYIFDEELTACLWPHRKRYQHLKDELKRLESRSWDYEDVEDREHKRKQTEDLRLEVLVESANANAEQKAAWDKRERERWDEELQRLAGKGI